MAAKAPPSQQSSEAETQLLENEFQFVLCEVCQKESPNLKLLTCLHTLCLGCLSENKPFGQCPVCQTTIPQASSISDMDNLLFASLQARLSIYRKIVDRVDLFCDNCKKEGEFWCSECEEFLCKTCFEAHQRYLKRDSHEARRVTDVRAGSARDFLEHTRKTSNLSCSNTTHKSQTLSIYCKKCCKPICCVCALLDSKHAGQHCDINTEIQLRQEELRTMSLELKQRKSGFEDAYKVLQNEAARLEQVSSETREQIQQRVEQLVRLIRQEEEELLGLVETRREQGHRELVGELQRVEGVLRRMEAGERLVEKMSLYATEQEVMDMQPFIKDSLEDLRRLQPTVAGGRVQAAGDFAECRSRLQALVARVTGQTEATSAQATENSCQVLAASTPVKRKNVQNADVLPSPVKVIKVENNDIEWMNSKVLQRQSSLDQPGTSYSVSTVRHTTREDGLLEDRQNSNGGLHDSDNDLFCLDSFEEDSSDNESLDSSLLDEPNSTLDESTSEECLGIAPTNLAALDSRQGYLMFFDVKILKNEIIQVAVVDKEKVFPVLIQPVKCLSALMAKNSVCEVGLKNLLCHLNTVNRPILGGFGLWSLPFPTLLKALTFVDKKGEFSSAVYGFLDVLPPIKEKIPGRDNYKLKTLANTYLWRQLSDCNAMETARAVKDLYEVLDIDLVRESRLILSCDSLKCFISLEPLLTEKLLTKPSAQTLARHNIGLSELSTCYRHNPNKGLWRVCRLINAHRHSSEKRVRNLSKIKVYFQRQQQSAECQTTPAGSDFLGTIKTDP
ncbi:protein PML-like isoform X2 [Rhea pennata]|uniref:protein PML-like isoform X2 n=1 Tax=Rhea pennata TaxID=8795 RepID=UPI002E252377